MMRIPRAPVPWRLVSTVWRWLFRCAAAVALFVAAPAAVAQTPPLHQRIDAQIANDHVGPLAPVAGDADFVRRVYLDLVGVIPTSSETRGFLADAAADKRAKLIDRLLAIPQHARHLANVLDVMLMERRPDKLVTAAEWQQYLYDSTLANKPYDVLAREILSSDGGEPATRAAAKFVLDRDAEPNLLTRDVGRIFFGRDLQCAQCHDHPLVDDYYQADYYGLFAFFNRTVLFARPDGDKKTILMDNATGEVGFQSVFDPAAKGNTLPRVPGGRQLEEPRFNPGEEWTVAPAKNVRHVPKYSRRGQLAGQTAVATNKYFNRNIANRLWAQMLGIGLVEPVDWHNRNNPPTSPQLLEMLADELVASKYDLRAMLREIALSQTYQRSLDLPADLAAQAAQASAAVAALEAERAKLKAAADASQIEVAKLSSELTAARKTIPPLFDELTKAGAAIPEVRKAIDTANKAVADAQAPLAPKQAIVKTVADAAAQAKIAAAKLPAEKDLAEAAAKFQTRADQLTAELAPMLKVVEEKAAAVKAAQDKLTAIQTAQTEINTRIDAARKQIIAVEERHEAAGVKQRAEQFNDLLAERRLAEAKLQSQLAAATGAAAASHAALNKLNADVTAAKAATTKLTAHLPALQAAQAVAQKANDDAAAALAGPKQNLDTRQAAHKEFADVLAKADAAAKALPQDAELAQTAQKLKARTDQLAAELATAQTEFAAKDQTAKAAAAQLAATAQAVANANAQLASATPNIAALEAQAAAAQQQAAADAAAAQQLARDIPERWSREFAVRPLRQLSPEQFGWSILRATGVYENQFAASSAEIEKATPLSEAAKADPVQLAARQKQVFDATHAKLAPNIVTFVQLFGGGAGQPQTDFYATVDQALFLANGGPVKSWLAPAGDNLTARLAKLEDPKLLADELYLTVLTRQPSVPEIVEVTKYLAARPTERAVVIQELAWSLISSAEFRFNR